MADVICNGIYLTKDLGIMINKITPNDVLAEERIDKLTFKRMNGVVYKETEAYEAYPLDIECTIPKRLGYEKIKEIKNFLKQRNCELILYNKPNVILKARLISKVNFDMPIHLDGEFLLSYEVQPFAELIEGRKWITISNNKKLINLGNYESKPLIKIFGTGSITITYNSKTMKFTNVKKTFIIDTELEDVYGIDGENLNNYMDINSDFIAFPEGEFTISYSGASSVEIMPRWREL